MRLLDWFRANGLLSGWLGAVSAVLFVASLVLMPLFVVRMRPDYFIAPLSPPASRPAGHPAVRFAVRGIKNLLGVMLLLMGTAMLILPGQGVITMLVGITLLDFPGKRRLELAIVRQRPVLRAITWIRTKAKRPPLILPEA